MELSKAERITRVKAKFERGYVEGDIGQDFVNLFISGVKEFNENGNYNYWNWNLDELKNLADAIYAFLKETKPELSTLKGEQLDKLTIRKNNKETK